MSSNKESSIGFCALLALIFITLKLCKVIAWSWWLVLLPLYFWVPILMIFLLVLAVLYILSM